MGKLFLILCLGAFLARINLLDVHTKQKLTKLLLYVTTPLMMIDAFYERMKTVELQEQTENKTPEEKLAEDNKIVVIM